MIQEQNKMQKLVVKLKPKARAKRQVINKAKLTKAPEMDTEEAELQIQIELGIKEMARHFHYLTNIPQILDDLKMLMEGRVGFELEETKQAYHSIAQKAMVRMTALENVAAALDEVGLECLDKLMVQ